MTANSQNVTFRVKRYDPEKDREPHWQEFLVPTKRGMTVLEGLIHIRENLSSSLVFRTSCRMGICGSCGMLINRHPHLACHTQIEEFHSAVITVSALPNASIIKDLAVDLTPLFLHHRAIKPYIIRNDQGQSDQAAMEYRQLPEELEAYEQFSYCIKCGLCIAACPTAASDPQFAGPQALGQCYRYCADSRDGGTAERLKVVDGNHGAWRCHLAGACSEACPKGVDPALAIQLLKRKMAGQALKARGRSPAGHYIPPVTSKTRIEVPPFSAIGRRPA